MQNIERIHSERSVGRLFAAVSLALFLLVFALHSL